MRVMYSKVALFVCLSFRSFKQEDYGCIIIDRFSKMKNKMKYCLLVVMTLKICQRRSE